MKLIKCTLAICVAATLLISCGGDKKKDDKSATDDAKKPAAVTDKGTASKLEGTWVIKREGGDFNGGTVGTTYEFKGSKLTTAGEGLSFPGSTEVTEKTFSFLADGGKDKILYDYHFDGDTLVAQMQDGPQVFYMIRK